MVLLAITLWFDGTENKNLTRRLFLPFSQQTVKRSDETLEFCKFSRLPLLLDEVLTVLCIQIGSPRCYPGMSSSTRSCDPGPDLVISPVVFSDFVSPTSCNLPFIRNRSCRSASRSFLPFSMLSSLYRLSLIYTTDWRPFKGARLTPGSILLDRLPSLFLTCVARSAYP